MSDKHDKKTDQPAFINANRRGFLQGAVVAGGAAATGVAVASGAIDEPSVEPAAPADRKGYELTDHVKKYYQRARF